MKILKKIGIAALSVFGALVALIILVYVLLCGRGGKYYEKDGSYRRVTSNSSFNYIMDHPALVGMGENVLPLGSETLKTLTGPWKLKIMIPFLGKHEPTVVDGLNYAIDMAEQGKTEFVSFYSDAEKAEDPSKENTGLVVYSTAPGAPFALVVPGGGFTMLGVASSAYPYAEPLVDAGYNVIFLKYRVGVSEGEEDKLGATDRASADMAAAVDYILQNAGELGVSAEDYILIGSSAGGQLTARFCAEAEPAVDPAACIMLYPANCERYDYTGCTVPMYITVCEDDPKINVPGLDAAVEKMEKAGLTVSYNKFATGGHSFGIGVGTPAEGWMERGLAFAAEYLS